MSNLNLARVIWISYLTCRRRNLGLHSFGRLSPQDYECENIKSFSNWNTVYVVKNNYQYNLFDIEINIYNMQVHRLMVLLFIPCIFVVLCKTATRIEGLIIFMKLNVQKGDRYNKWTILDDVPVDPVRRKFLCQCDCWNIWAVELVRLRAKKRGSKSCWCNRFKHWMLWTLTHRSWASMKQRCLDEKHQAYHRYWWRWITVCDRWLESLLNFVEDMWERENKNMTLDRIDVNWNYEPWNCKWSTKSEQSRNTRRTRFFEGKKVTDIWEELWMNYTSLYSKLGKYSMDSIKLIKEYWPHAVVKKDKEWNVIAIYKDAVTAWKENNIVSWSISKCCRKDRINFTAWWFKWDFLLPEKTIEDNRERKKRWTYKKRLTNAWLE